MDLLSIWLTLITQVIFEDVAILTKNRAGWPFVALLLEFSGRKRTNDGPAATDTALGLA